MFISQNNENHIISTEKKVEELQIRNDALDREIHAFLKEWEVTEEQLTHFLSQKQHFSDEAWEILHQEKKKLDEKLHKELTSLSCPKQRKQTQKDRNVPPTWLFVR